MRLIRPDDGGECNGCPALSPALLPVQVLNLARKPDSLISVSKEMMAAGLKFHRFENPFDAANSTAKRTAEEQMVIQNLRSPRCGNVSDAYGIGMRISAFSGWDVCNSSGGEPAATTSHLRMWKDALLRNVDMVLVAEDDVLLEEGAIARIERALRALRGVPWDALFFTYDRRVNPMGVDEAAPPGLWQFERSAVWNFGGGVLYALSRRGLERFVKWVDAHGMPMPVDWTMMQMCKSQCYGWVGNVIRGVYGDADQSEVSHNPG